MVLIIAGGGVLGIRGSESAKSSPDVDVWVLVLSSLTLLFFVFVLVVTSHNV